MSLVSLEFPSQPEEQPSVPLLRPDEVSRVPKQDYGAVLGTEVAAEHTVPNVPPMHDQESVLFDDEERGQVQRSSRPAVDLRKYVFISMGIPSVVSAPQEFKRNCILVSSLLYFLLFVLGFVIVIVTLRSEDLLKEKAELFAAKIATILSGLFFILLEVYWLVLFWWSRPARSGDLPFSHRDFSPYGLLWWLLSIYFIAVLTSLCTEVLRNFHTIFGSGDSDVLPIKAAFVCMLVCLYVYVAIFLIIKLEALVADRWMAKRQKLLG